MKLYIIYILTATCVFFTPITGLMVAVGAAIILDTFFGIYRSIKIRGWKFITSRRLSEIISKMLLYQSCIICLYVIDFFILTEFFQKWFSIGFFATKMCALLLIFIESVSIKENFESATGLDIFSLLKSALGRAKEVKTSVTDIIDK